MRNNVKCHAASRPKVQVRQPLFIAGCGQVFGLPGASVLREFLLASASQPQWASAFVEDFVPGYRCGTVLDLHQIPYFYASFTPRTNSIRERSTCGPHSRTAGAGQK